MISITRGVEMARVYREAGITYFARVEGIGWVLNDEPTPQMEVAAEWLRGVLNGTEAAATYPEALVEC